MSNVESIHADKTPIRIHFIVEWAARFNLKQSDIVEQIGADKSLVSRWFDGTLPGPGYLEKLAALFQMDDVHSIFRHPDDDWLLKLLRRHDSEDSKLDDMMKGKTQAELDLAIRVMKSALSGG